MAFERRRCAAPAICLNGHRRAHLRPFQRHELAKPGDSVKYQLLAEYALVAKQQASCVQIW